MCTAIVRWWKVCLAVVCVEAGFSQIWSHIPVFRHSCLLNDLCLVTGSNLFCLSVAGNWLLMASYYYYYYLSDKQRWQCTKVEGECGLLLGWLTGRDRRLFQITKLNGMLSEKIFLFLQATYLNHLAIENSDVEYFWTTLNFSSQSYEQVHS